MDITYVSEKRALILVTRCLDFDDAVHIFAGTELTVEDDRKEYGETRYLTLPMLATGWWRWSGPPRGAARHIISMRKANERERKKYEGRLDRSG